MTVREAKKILNDNGFTMKSHRGSHVKYVKDKKVFMLVSHGAKSEKLHPKTIKDLNNIIK